MKKKTKISLKKWSVNCLGAVGYFFSSLQWLWVVVLYSSLVIGLAKIMSQGKTNQTVAPSNNIDINSNIPMIIIAAVIVFVIVVLTLYIIIKIPSTLVKTSEKAVHSAADNVAPLVLQLQRKKDTKRNHLKLTPFLIVIMKLILVFLPVALAFISQFIGKQVLDFFIAAYVSVLLACFSLLFFVFQYLVAELMSIKKKDIW